MPWPTKGEKKDHYMIRAIPAIMSDTGKSKEAAIEQARGMWKQKRPKKKKVYEGVNLDHAYPFQPGQYDSPDFHQFNFTTDTGTSYKIVLSIDDIYYRDDSPKFMEILFGDTDDEGAPNYKRKEVGIKEMYRILATVVKAVFECLNENPLILALVFDADKGEDSEHNGSRQKSYRTMAAQLAKYLEWNYAVSSKSSANEKYYVVCPKLPEEMIEEMLRHHEDMDNPGVFSSMNRPVDKSIVAQLRGKKEDEVLHEKFTTMVRCRQPQEKTSILMSLYQNPTTDEMRRYVAFASRGYINHLGDLYLEGYEKEEGGSKKITSVVHGVILQALKNHNPRIVKGDPDWVWTSTTSGVTVQRHADSDNIYVGESITTSREANVDIRRWMNLAKKKNPHLQFIPKSINKLGRAGRGGWGNLAMQGRRLVRKPKVQEGIGQMYYWKDGGPTRYQNEPGTFDDVNSHRAGMALDKGFDLNKREVCYSGPVVGDRIHTIHESMEDDHLGEILEWDTLRGEKHKGPVVELDGNIVFVDCEICGHIVAIEDGVDMLHEDSLQEFFNSIDEDVGMSANFQAHAPEHMIGMNGVANITNKGTGNTKHGKMRDNEWDSAYTRTRSEDYLRVHESKEKFDVRYESWPFDNPWAKGYPSWVLYKEGAPIAALANDNEHEDDVSIRHIEAKVKGNGYAQKLIEMLLKSGVTITTGKANYNSISPSMYRLINRVNEKTYIERKRIGPADNTGKGYKELDGVEVNHYQWKLKK